jgi:hypothetical protein
VANSDNVNKVIKKVVTFYLELEKGVEGGTFDFSGHEKANYCSIGVPDSFRLTDTIVIRGCVRNRQIIRAQGALERGSGY